MGTGSLIHLVSCVSPDQKCHTSSYLDHRSHTLATYRNNALHHNHLRYTISRRHKPTVLFRLPLPTHTNHPP